MAANSDTTAPSGRELYHLQFSLQVASPETFGISFEISLSHRREENFKTKLVENSTELVVWLTRVG